VGEYEFSLNDVPGRQGLVEFVWNAKRKAFDEAQK
jgi:hypothetical protein